MATKTAKRIRWECPTGSHPAQLGPRRPAADATVRYCLPCSEATGRLVLRVAPVLERARADAAERSKAKATRQRATAARARARALAAETARYTVAGHDLRDEAARLCRLHLFRGTRLARQAPRLDVTHRRAATNQVGLAFPWEWRIHLTLRPDIPWAIVRATLVHELVHLATADQHPGADPHGPEFARIMRRAFRQAYGPDIVGLRSNACNIGPYAAALTRAEQEA